MQRGLRLPEDVWLAGKGPSLDSYDWNKAGICRIGINETAFVIPKCFGAFGIDYNVLDKYKKVTNVQQTSEPIEQIMNQEEVKEISNLTDKVVQEQKVEPSKQSEQETIPDLGISSNLTYTKKLEEFYNSLSNSSNFADKLIE